MASHECHISDAEAQVTLPPALDPNFLTPGYEPPVGKVLRPWFNIKIYYSPTDFEEFNWFYVAGSANGEGVYGSRGFANLTLRNNNRQAFDLPFMPIEDLYIELTDELGEVFSGYIQNVRKELIGQRLDGTPLQFLHLECEDLWGLLEQDTYSEVYVNKPVGYILRDAFKRAGFDVSEIDPNLGQVYASYPVTDLFPVDVVTPLLGLLDYTYWIDGPTRKMYVFPRDTQQTEILRVTEDNWSYLFDRDLEILPDKTGFANKLILSHELKWNEGTANFEQGTDVVLGYTGNEMWVRLPQDELSIENLLTGKIYRINDNNSDDEETNELILEQNYKEDTSSGAGTNVPYLIRGAKSKVIERNTASILQRRAFRGGSGIVTKTVVMDNFPLYRSEARRIAKAELAIASRDMYMGSGRSDNHRLRQLLTSAPQAGKTLYFDTFVTFGVQGRVRIETHRWQDISTRVQRDGLKLQGWGYEFEFTPSVSREQIREIAKNMSKSGVRSDDATILDVEFVDDNTVIFKDCLSVIAPIKPAGQNVAEFEDGLAHREVTIQTYYFAPATTHPTQEAYFTGLTKFSNFS